MLPIATCTQCGRPLCAQHAWQFDGKIVCSGDATLLTEQADIRLRGQLGPLQEDGIATYERAVRGVADWAAGRGEAVECLLLMSEFGPIRWWVNGRGINDINDKLAKETRTRLFGARPPDYIDATLGYWKAWKDASYWKGWAIRSDRLAGWLMAKSPSGWGKIRISRVKSSAAYQLPKPPENPQEFLLSDGRIALASPDGYVVGNLRKIRGSSIVTATVLSVLPVPPESVQELIEASEKVHEQMPQDLRAGISQAMKYDVRTLQDEAIRPWY
jgi:hypothetical protein